MSSSETISAEVVLKSKSGKSIFESGVVVTSENISEFMPDKTWISKAITTFQKMGFKTYQGDYSISIIGPKNLFEEIFKTKISSAQDHKEHILDVPPNIKHLVERVFIPEKPEYF